MLAGQGTEACDVERGVSLDRHPGAQIGLIVGQLGAHVGHGEGEPHGAADGPHQHCHQTHQQSCFHVVTTTVTVNSELLS